MTHPWPAGAATATGSLPFVDPAEATRLVLGELPDLAFLPELPARGPGADMVGRGAALLVDLPTAIVPSGWRVTAAPGRDLRRARDLLAADLDALHETADGFTGVLKVQVIGPWTLAASLELWNGHRMVSDHGATRDLAESLAAGVADHLAGVRARVPGATVVLQLDEPSLPAVLGGRVPTPSDHGTVRSVDAETVDRLLRTVLDVGPEAGRIVHCCAPDAPLELIRAAGADALAVDMTTEPDPGVIDQFGQAVDAGVALWLGVVPGTDGAVDHRRGLDRITKVWRTLGFPPADLAANVVPSTACGLAGASPTYARRALSVVRDIGRALADLD